MAIKDAFTTISPLPTLWYGFGESMIFWITSRVNNNCASTIKQYNMNLLSVGYERNEIRSGKKGA